MRLCPRNDGARSRKGYWGRKEQVEAKKAASPRGLVAAALQVVTVNDCMSPRKLPPPPPNGVGYNLPRTPNPEPRTPNPEPRTPNEPPNTLDPPSTISADPPVPSGAGKKSPVRGEGAFKGAAPDWARLTDKVTRRIRLSFSFPRNDQLNSRSLWCTPSCRPL